MDVQHAAATRIQRSWRTHAESTLVDPITKCRVVEPLFVHAATSGKVITFSAVPLSRYLELTGDYRNPVTREQFNDADIGRLRHVLQAAHVPTSVQADFATATRAQRRRSWSDEVDVHCFLRDDLFMATRDIRHLLEQRDNSSNAVDFLLRRTRLPLLQVALARLAARCGNKAACEAADVALDILKQPYTSLRHQAAYSVATRYLLALRERAAAGQRRESRRRFENRNRRVSEKATKAKTVSWRSCLFLWCPWTRRRADHRRPRRFL